MEGYRPAFDSDTELADAELADAELVDAELVDAGRVDTVPVDAAPADAAHMPTRTRFDPACFPLSEPYSLDGITAIPADVFRRSRGPR
jgi:hypothetical protein